MRVLVTGGAGYVGSHTLLPLLRARHEVLVFDNFSNGSPEALRRVKQLSNADFDVCAGDIRDAQKLGQAFGEFRPDAVIHLAGLKSVGESDRRPLEYYSQNVVGSIELLKAMQRHHCRKIVFSSSATVYGEARYLPCDEEHPTLPLKPYGRTKYFIEQIIRDWSSVEAGSSAVLLRYFNPAGADASGRIGEDPIGVPANLVPYIAQVAAGRRASLRIFGGDYETRDGTGERDFVHVEDLARAHVAAIDHVARSPGCEAINVGAGSGATVLHVEDLARAHVAAIDHVARRPGCEAINVGAGSGATVLEMVKAFEKASGRPIPFTITARREGDVSRSLAAARKAESMLGWKAERDIADICETAWRWQSGNPDGYGNPK